MRLNNFSENSRFAPKTHEKRQKTMDMTQKSNFKLQISIRLSTQNNNFWSKDKLKTNKKKDKLDPLIIQHLKKSQSSKLQALGTVLIKIIIHQIFQYGYSSLKLNILKSINDFEKQKIFQKYLQDFNFKTTSHQLLTILNSSIKILNKKLSDLQFSELAGENVQKHTKKNDYELNCRKIHDVVMNHLNQFPICSHFFTIFIKMLLMLVKYPKLNSDHSLLNSKQVFFIVSDYLNCKIQYKPSYFLFDNIHFIKQKYSEIQFGIIRQFSQPIKENSRLKNQQTRSTINLNLSQTHLRYHKNNPLNPEHRLKPETEILKQSFYVFNNKKIQKCTSRLQLKSQYTTIEKSNKNLNAEDQAQINKKWQNNKVLNSINTVDSMYVEKKYNFLQRNSLNVSHVGKFSDSSPKCQRCINRGQLSIINNVVEIKV